MRGGEHQVARQRRAGAEIALASTIITIGRAAQPVAGGASPVTAKAGAAEQQQARAARAGRMARMGLGARDLSTRRPYHVLHLLTAPAVEPLSLDEAKAYPARRAQRRRRGDRRADRRRAHPCRGADAARADHAKLAAVVRRLAGGRPDRGACRRRCRRSPPRASTISTATRRRSTLQAFVLDVGRLRARSSRPGRCRRRAASRPASSST